MNNRTTLCLRHRRALELDPNKASQCWQKAMHCARYEINSRQWERARERYFHAIEVAEILLHNDDNAKRSESRLLQTSMEYAYLLHALAIPTEGLAKYIRACLTNVECTRPINELTDPIDGIANTNPRECAQWLSGIAQSHFSAINGSVH